MDTMQWYIRFWLDWQNCIQYIPVVILQYLELRLKMSYCGDKSTNLKASVISTMLPTGTTDTILMASPANSKGLTDTFSPKPEHNWYHDPVVATRARGVSILINV